MTRIASRLAVRVEDGDTIDNKGLRQRYKYTGRRDRDFTKWDHKARIFVSARFGSDIFAAMNWPKISGKGIIPTWKNSELRGRLWRECRWLTENSRLGMKAPQSLRVPRFVHDWRCELCGQKQWRRSRIGSLASALQLVRSDFEQLEGHNSRTRAESAPMRAH